MEDDYQAIKYRIKPEDTLVNLVADEIRKQILNNHYKPGDLLPSQGELARLFSVSVVVIRGAIQKLSTHGLIEISQGKRARVIQPDTKFAISILNTLVQQGHSSIEDLYEVRAMIESEIASIAALKAEPKDIEDLENLYQKIINAETIEEKSEADFLFHRKLALSTRNQFFVLLIDTLRDLLKESQLKSYEIVGVKPQIEPHTPILEAIKSRNRELARKSMIEHLLEALWNYDSSGKKKYTRFD